MEDTSTSTAAPVRARRARARKPPSRPAASARTCACVIPDGVPEFKSFRHIRNPKVRRAKDYEQHLLRLKELFPEYNQGIDAQIAYARSQQERDVVSDRDRVLGLLEKWPGGVRCSEVAGDLEIPYATAYKILREFLDTGIAAATERRGIAGNKPYLVFTLAH